MFKQTWTIRLGNLQHASCNQHLVNNDRFMAHLWFLLLIKENIPSIWCLCMVSKRWLDRSLTTTLQGTMPDFCGLKIDSTVAKLSILLMQPLKVWTWSDLCTTGTRWISRSIFATWYFHESASTCEKCENILQRIRLCESWSRTWTSTYLLLLLRIEIGVSIINLYSWLWPWLWMKQWLWLWLWLCLWLWLWL